MRQELITSGVPVMIASVCLAVLAYLAAVRRERFLLYWTAAWALLLLRYIWGEFAGSPWPHPLAGTASAYLRLTFAGCLLAGVEELRGRRVDARIVFLAAALFLGIKEPLDAFMSRQLMIGINMGLMMVIMLTAGWRLGSYRQLPPTERYFEALALSLYALLTASMPFLAEDSPLLRPGFFASWTLQLCIGIGMLALFFRASYEAELEVEKQRGATLAEALRDFLPICMHCKSIRDEQQNWKTIEAYVADRSVIRFSHGLCPTCTSKHYGELDG